MSDYHTLLGVKPGAVLGEIKLAWRAKCHEHHPDKGGDQAAFLRIMHAYRMLTDPDYQTQNKPLRSLDFQIQVAVTFEEGFFGKSMVVNFNRVILDNKGEQVVSDIIEPLILSFIIPTGSVGTLEIIEPAMGMKMGGVVGDAHIKVTVNRHDRYEIKGVDVLAFEKVPLGTMLKGGYIEVQTLYGLRTAWIPPGTPPDGRIRVKNCGVRKEGHHLAVIEPLFPSVDDLKGDSWKGLGIQWQEQEKQKDEELVDLHDKLRTPVSAL